MYLSGNGSRLSRRTPFFYFICNHAFYDCASADNPGFGDAGVLIELDTDLYHPAAFCLIGNGIAFGVDLFKGFLRSAVGF